MLPRALNNALSRFQSSKESIRILPTSKTTFGDNEQIIFKFPNSGVIDTYNLSLVGKFTFTSTSDGAKPLVFNFGQLISRFEVLSGGTVLFGAGASDFSTAYMARRMIAEPGYVAASSNKVYDQISVPGPTGSTSPSNVATVTAMMNDMPGLCFKNMRFLPLAAFPADIEIRITLSVAARMGLAAGLSFTSVEPYILASKVTIPGALSVDVMVDKLLESGEPLEIAFENWTTQTGNAVSSEGSTPYSISTKSLDYLLHVWRNVARTPGEYHTSTTMGGGARYQIQVNNVPLSSWQLSNDDVWWKLSESLDAGQGNMLVDPQVASLSEWVTTKFLLCERFCFPTVDSYESRSLISGLNTQGQSIPIRVDVFGGSQTRVPTAIFIHTSTIELYPGRVLTVVN